MKILKNRISIKGRDFYSKSKIYSQICNPCLKRQRSIKNSSLCSILTKRNSCISFRRIRGSLRRRKEIFHPFTHPRKQKILKVISFKGKPPYHQYFHKSLKDQKQIEARSIPRAIVNNPNGLKSINYLINFPI